MSEVGEEGGSYTDDDEQSFDDDANSVDDGDDSFENWKKRMASLMGPPRKRFKEELAKERSRRDIWKKEV